MDKKIELLLQNKGQNHIAPFFWQHGEEEAVLRKYMEVIQAAGCQAVCVESRPHPDFCGTGWWRDMDIILDEARKRSMKVWILDDSHFPTGYANGALEDAPAELCRQSVFSNKVTEETVDGKINIDVKKYVHAPKLKLSRLAELAGSMMPPPREFDDDTLLSVTAVSRETGEIRNLTEGMAGGVIEWESPNGKWDIYVNGLSRNCGPHRSYINMLDNMSCRVLIDTVYEPHYELYKNDFGNTIAGFFSDEPELGNGILYMQNNPMGTKQDLPWSREVGEALTRCMGENWKTQLPLLWDQDRGDGEPKTQAEAQIRYIYMDTITRLVQKDFSEQIGNWCHEHGVLYIGHVIEDEGQHCRTASSLGHYFRGLKGQDMAGIDDIGGQVSPGGENGPNEGPMERTRNGEFYHYGLAMLAASAAAIEPKKKGRAMCEIFGNYGWKEGVRLEKYLADHFLVRGINYFVPHAFSPKPYPDPDCAPHFYAHGHNPQYRHFGKLIGYMNRVSELFSDGRRIVTAAILYHGESEWSGNCMPFEKVARKLYDNQICADVIPSDVFAEPGEYKTKMGDRLQINTQEYQVLIIPEAQFITKETWEAVTRLQKNDFPVFFINSVPDCCTGTVEFHKTDCRVIALEKLAETMHAENLYEVQIEPENNRVRVLHYRGEHDMFMLVNEGDDVYSGKISLPADGACYEYNAMENRTEYISYCSKNHQTELKLELYPGKSKILVFDEISQKLLTCPVETKGEEMALDTWVRSQCRSIEYPEFTSDVTVSLPDQLAQEQPEFSGYVRYKTEIELVDTGKWVLEITDACEGAEIFINGSSCGIQLVSPMLYDITEFVKVGKNQIAIEIATTLERERAVGAKDIFEQAMMEPPVSGSGITGQVNLYRENRKNREDQK